MIHEVKIFLVPLILPPAQAPEVSGQALCERHHKSRSHVSVLRNTLNCSHFLVYHGKLVGDTLSRVFRAMRLILPCTYWCQFRDIFILSKLEYWFWLGRQQRFVRNVRVET